MAIVYDVEISVHVKSDEKDNTHYRGFTISMPNAKYENFASTWPEVLYQAAMSKDLLEKELAEEKSNN